MDDDREETIDTTRYRIKPLTSESYYLWAWKMKLFLKGKGLWQIVTGVEREPEATSEKKKILQRKDLVLRTILLAISKSCCAPVVNIEDPKDVWEEVQKTYESMSRAHMGAFITQIQAIKINATEKWISLIASKRWRTSWQLLGTPWMLMTKEEYCIVEFGKNTASPYK